MFINNIHEMIRMGFHYLCSTYLYSTLKSVMSNFSINVLSNNEISLGDKRFGISCLGIV